MRRSKLAAMTLALAACGAPAEPSPRVPPMAAPPPVTVPTAPVATVTPAPFVVAIVVDQLSAWVAASRLPELPREGGFARLAREGTWAKNVRYPYAVTDTGPGHTSLHTGKVPSESGIFGNELPGPIGEKRVSILRDDTVKVVGASGPVDQPGSSASRLHVDTVADRLRAAHPDALIVSVSVKDRGAILPAGKHPTHALWFDAPSDSFVTSTAFASTFPRWALGVGDHGAVVNARKKPWELTDPAWTKAHAATPDDQPGEGNLEGFGVTFPHVGTNAAMFRGMPASDSMIAELGLAAMGAEYDPKRTTLLLLSFSASDTVGHVFGPDSWEEWDHLRKLDAVLAAVIESLDRRVGRPVSVMLAADHGNISMPEVPPERAGVKCVNGRSVDPYERSCTPGMRLGPNALRDELIVAVRAALGPGSFIRGVADPYLYLTDDARALPEARRAQLDRIIRATLGKHAGVMDVLDTRALVTRCPPLLAKALGAPDRARPGEDIITLVCRSWADGLGAGDYYVTTHLGSFFDGELVVGKGTSHGTPYLYDRTVPLLVRAPGVIDAGVVIDDPVDFTAYSALEAALVGIDPRAPRAVLASSTAR